MLPLVAGPNVIMDDETDVVFDNKFNDAQHNNSEPIPLVAGPRVIFDDELAAVFDHRDDVYSATVCSAQNRVEFRRAIETGEETDEFDRRENARKKTKYINEFKE